MSETWNSSKQTSRHLPRDARRDRGQRIGLALQRRELVVDVAHEGVEMDAGLAPDRARWRRRRPSAGSCRARRRPRGTARGAARVGRTGVSAATAGRRERRPARRTAARAGSSAADCAASTTMPRSARSVAIGPAAADAGVIAGAPARRCRQRRNQRRSPIGNARNGVESGATLGHTPAMIPGTRPASPAGRAGLGRRLRCSARACRRPAPPRGSLRTATGARGRCARCPRSTAPNSIATTPSAISSEAMGPMTCTPRMRSVAASARILTKPVVSPSARARPLAANGKLPAR